MLPRFFIDKEEIREGDLIALPEEEAHHMRVLRLRPGERLLLLNGRGITATASLVRLDTFLVEGIVYTPPPSDLTLALASPLPKNLEWILEKGCELGISHFILFPAERSKVPLLQLSSRHRRILIAALKQCGRSWFPKITLLSSFPKPHGALFFGSLNHAPSFLFYLHNLAPPITFFIGPESGWTSHEELLLEQLGAKKVSLNRHTLRVETAAIVAAAFLSLIPSSS